MNICFFIGHREAGDELLPALTAEVERHITEYDVTSFMVGRYGNFDKLAARAVIDTKKRHPEATLTLLLPYHPFDRPTPTPKGFDGTFYPPDMETVPKRVAIVRANRYMIENSTHLIAYAWHPASNAREILEAALRRQERGMMQVTNLAPQGKGYLCEPDHL